MSEEITQEQPQPTELWDVKEKLNAREWDAINQYLEEEKTEAVAQAIKETFEEARASTEKAIDSELDHFKANHICLPAEADAVDLFWEYVEKRLDSADYPETTTKQIVMRMMASVITHSH